MHLEGNLKKEERCVGNGKPFDEFSWRTTPNTVVFVFYLVGFCGVFWWKKTKFGLFSVLWGLYLFVSALLYLESF